MLQPIISDLRAALNQPKVGVNSVITNAEGSGVAITRMRLGRDQDEIRVMLG